MDVSRVLEQVAAKLRSEVAVDAEHHRIELACTGGALTLRGEVEDMRAKRAAVRRAAEVDGVTEVIDRLAIRRSVAMSDGEIRTRVRDALLNEPALMELALRERVKGELRVVREEIGGRGEIVIDVQDGAVTLRGRAPSLSHRRLAVAIAWWIPGTRNVVDEVAVVPAEEDHDGEIADALLILLEKDPVVDPASLTLHVEDGVVTMHGWVPQDAVRRAAERDAWFVEGVRDVVNEIRVGAYGSTNVAPLTL